MFWIRNILWPARILRLIKISNKNNNTIRSYILLHYNKQSPCNTYNLYYSSLKRSNKLDNNDKSLYASKERIIKLLNFEDDVHAIPFYKLPIKTLLHIYKVTKNDDSKGFCKNRLYYLSSKIKCPPSVLSGRLAQRPFVYSLSFNWLESSVNVLLEMNVSGERIIRDLWVLKYHSETIRERLEKVKSLGVKNLYPWMVRCSEEILNRYINMTLEAKNILGDTQTTHMYLANRLNISQKELDEIFFKVPTLKTIRVAKVKHFLDFLIKEGFEVKDIASKPRVLAASQKTIAKRLKQLRSLGLQHINLNVLCRSRKDFKKYIESMSVVQKVKV